MAKRTVAIGLMTFTDASGREGQFAQHGAEVDVHTDDLDRFDRLNVAPEADAETGDTGPAAAAVSYPAEPPAVEPPAEPPAGDPDDEPVDLTKMTKDELLDYAGSIEVDLGAARTKAEIITAIQAAQA